MYIFEVPVLGASFCQYSDYYLLMLSIIGGGFGLYGYLPAACLSGYSSIGLLARHQDRFYKRPELIDYERNIVWFQSIKQLLGCSSTVVIAVPPQLQYQMIGEVICSPSIKTVILEKPLASGPRQAKEILSKLELAGKRILVNYSFVYMPWFNDLLSQIFRLRRLEISWSFMAHHFKDPELANCWKANPSVGGGALHFYGIHLLPLMCMLFSEAGKLSWIRSSLSAQDLRWSCNFKAVGTNGLHGSIDVDTCSETEIFSVRAFNHDGKGVFNLNQATPFQAHASSLVRAHAFEQDPRIPCLQSLLATLVSQEFCLCPPLYHEVNQLWERVESISRH